MCAASYDFPTVSAQSVGAVKQQQRPKSAPHFICDMFYSPRSKVTLNQTPNQRLTRFAHQNSCSFTNSNSMSATLTHNEMRHIYASNFINIQSICIATKLRLKCWLVVYINAELTRPKLGI